MSIAEEKRYWLERNFIVDLLKQLPSHIFWKNKDGVYLGCNDAFAQSLGLSSPEEIIGKTDYDLPVSKEESDAYRADDIEVMQSRQPKPNIEEPQTLPDGKIITLLTSKVPLLDKNSEVIGVLGIYYDITERKKMELALKTAKETAEAADQAKTAFIANMSHDIRTPISGIIAIAEMLKKEGESHKDREYGDIIHNSSESLLSLLNDILVISTNVATEENVQLETFNLKERIAHLEKLFSANTKLKYIKFEINSAADLPEYIVSDRIKIDRILLNLIGNALKFTDAGYVRLTTKFLQKNTNKTMIEFSVSDTGIGISKDKMDKIFDRFYRVSPSYEGKYTGSGMGLFIVKKLVGLLNGKIKVKSELGKGTTFIVTFPIEMKKEEIKKINVDPPQKIPLDITDTLSISNGNIVLNIFSDKKNNELKILFIEDDPIAKMAGQYFLESAGFKIETVVDGEEGLKKVKSSIFDLVITDIGLPGINGIELALLIRRWEKQSNKISLPIVGLSAHVSEEIRKEAAEVGINLLLEKPMDDRKIKMLLEILKEKEIPLSSMSS